jgi:hypothetical protein
MAVAVADAGEGGSPGPRGVERLVTRWSLLTGRARWLLEVVRFAVPVAALVLGLGAAMEQGGPFNPGQGMTTGQAVQELKVAVNLLANLETAAPSSKRPVRGGPPDEGGSVTAGAPAAITGVGGLEELGQLVGVPMSAAARSFTLDRLVTDPPTLYLHHRETGALLVVAEGRRAALERGTWRVVE